MGTATTATRATRAMTARVRQREIAACAGVSVSTVSRVLAGAPGIGAELTQRVQAAAAALGYRPAPLIGMPSLRHIALFVTFHAPPAPDTFYVDVLTGVEEACRARNLHLSYTVLQEGVDIAARVGALDADGVLLLATDDRAVVAAACATGKPTVLINAEHPGLPVDSFLPDNSGGASLATQHLLDHGHRELLHTTRLHRGTFFRRRDAFFAALSAAGIAPDPARVIEMPLEAAGALAVMQARLAAKNLPPFTAVFCANDYSAMGVVRALREAGRRVPEDVSVVGFDDAQFAAFIDPPLTTVRIERGELGHLAVERLAARAVTPHLTPMRAELACRLIERASVRRLTPPPRPR